MLRTFGKFRNFPRTLVVRSRFSTDSYCSWQKGAVENENKLIRQYIPKGTDISKVSDEKIMTIKKKINARPREKLNFLTPKEVFYRNFS